jgi:hypothetical protein
VQEDPSKSPYYQVHHEAEHADVPDEHRKDGKPNPMPAELVGLVGPRAGDTVARVQEGDA